MNSDREQAIKDVAGAMAWPSDTVSHYASLSTPHPIYSLARFAVSQRERVIQLERENAAKAERVIALERALRNARQSIVDGKPLGAVNLIDAALNGESK